MIDTDQEKDTCHTKAERVFKLNLSCSAALSSQNRNSDNEESKTGIRPANKNHARPKWKCYQNPRKQAEAELRFISTQIGR